MRKLASMRGRTILARVPRFSALRRGIAAVLFAALAVFSTEAFAIGGKLPYQGTLRQNGINMTGSHEMIFRIYTVPSGGAPVYTSPPTTVSISNGRFFTLLEPTGVNWESPLLYLEVTVDGVTLSPREEIGAAAQSFNTHLHGGKQYVSSGTTPSSGAQGDLWYDSSVNLLKFHDGSGWLALSTTTGGGGGGGAGTIASDAAQFSGTGEAGSPLTLLSSSITLQGNIFNAAGRLVRLDAAGRYPALDGSLITSITDNSKVAKTGDVMSGDLQVGSLRASTLSASGYVTLANLGSAPGPVRGRLYFDPTGQGSLKISLDGTSFVKLATGAAGAGLSFVVADAVQFSGDGTSGNILALQSSSVTLQGNVFNAPNKLLKLDVLGYYPGLNGSLITDISGANVSGNISGNAAGLVGNLPASQVAGGELDSSVIASSVAVNKVGTLQLEAGAVTRAKLAQDGCNGGEILKWDGAQWACALDVGSTYAADEQSLHLSGNQFSALPGSVTLQGNVFNVANRLLRLDGSGYYPALNGSLIQGLSGANIVGNITGSAANITENLPASQVGAGELNTNVIASSVAANKVGTLQIADNAVTDAKLAGSISQSKVTNLVSDLAGKIGVGTNMPAQNVDLSTVTAALADKVSKSGDSMSGPLTLLGSTLTVEGNAFSVGASTLVVSDGRVGIGAAASDASLDVSTGGWRKITLTTTGVAAKVRQGSDANGMNFTSNAYWDGTAWNTDDSSKAKFAYIQHLGNSRHEWRVAGSGAGVAWTTGMQLGSSGDFALAPGTPKASTFTAATGDWAINGAVTASSLTLTGSGNAYHLTFSSAHVLGAITWADGSVSTTAARSSGGVSSVLSDGAQFSGDGTSGNALTLKSSSVTLQGNAFNNANQLVKLDGSGDLQIGGQYASTIAAAGYLTLANLGSAPGSSRGRLYFDPTGDGALKVSLNGSSFVSIATGAAGAGLSSVAGESNQFSGDGTGGNVLTLKSSSVTLQGNTFNNANQLVKLDGSGYFPGLNGSLITNLSGANVSGNISGNAANITGNLSVSQVNLSTVMPLGAVSQQYVNLSTVTDALAGKIGVGTNILMENVNLSTVAASISDLYATKRSTGVAIEAAAVNLSTVAASISDLYAAKRSTGVAIEASAIDLSTVMPLGAVPQQYVNLSTVTDALAGKIGVGTNILMENVNLSTVAASISDLYAAKRSTGVAIEASAIDLSTVMPLGAVPQQYVNLSTVTDALAGKIGVGTNIPMENVNLSTVAASISDLYAAKRSTGIAIEASAIDLSTVMPLGAVPQQYVNLSTVTDALAGKIGVGTNIPMENVNLSTVAASISDLYAAKRSTGVAIEAAAIDLSTVMPLGAVPQQYVNLSTVTDALAGKIGVGANIPMENVNLSTVTDALAGKLDKSGGVMSGDLQVGDQYASTIAAAGYLTLANLGSAPGSSRGRLYFDPTGDGALKVSLNGSSFVSIATGTAGAGLSSVSGESNQFSGDGTSGNVLTLRSSSVTLQGNTFNNANQLVKLDGSGYFPGLNGSLITNLSGANVSGNITGSAANITGNLSVSQVNLSTVTDALAGKVGVGTNIPMENVNLSTVAASISDLYAAKRSTGIAIEASAIDLSTVMPLGAIPQQYVNLSTVTDALAGKIGVGTNIPMENVNLSTVAASISDLYATKRSTGVAIEASAIDLSTVMPLGAIPQQYVNLSTVTDALAGKIGVGTNIPMENVNLSTVTDALAGKIGVGTNIPMENVNLSTVAASISDLYAAKRSTGVAIEAAAINLSTVMPLGAIPQQYVNLSTVTDALAGKIGVGTNIPMENVNLSTVTDALAGKIGVGTNIPIENVNLSTVAASISDLYATKRSTGVAIEAAAVNLSTVAASISDLYVAKRSTGVAIETSAVNLSTVAASISDLYATKRSTGVAIEALAVNLSTVTDALAGKLDKSGGAMSGDLQVGDQYASTIAAAGYLTLANLGSAPGSSRGRLYFDPTGDGALKVSLNGSSFVSIATGTAGAGLSSVSGESNQFSGDGTSGNVLTLRSSSVTLQGNTFNNANQLVKLDGSGYFPGLNGSLITNLSGANVSGNISGNAANITGNLSVSQVNLSTVMPLGAVPQQYVNLSTVTDALAGKIGVGTNIPMENVNLSTVAASISDLYATKRSTGVAIEASAINLSTVMPLGAISQQYVNLSTVTDALAGKIGVGTNIPMENVNLSTVAASISDLYATKRSTGIAIEASAIDLSTVMPLGAVPQQYVNLSTVTDALAGKIGVGTNIPMENVNLSTVAASISDLYAIKRSTGVAIEVSAVNLSTVAASINDLYAAKRSTGVAIEAAAIDLSTVMPLGAVPQQYVNLSTVTDALAGKIGVGTNIPMENVNLSTVAASISDLYATKRSTGVAIEVSAVNLSTVAASINDLYAAKRSTGVAIEAAAIDLSTVMPLGAVPQQYVNLSTVTDALAGKLDKSGGAMSGDLQVGDQYASTIAAAGYLTLANLGSAPGSSRGRLYFDPTGDGALKVSLNGSSFVSIATGTAGAGLSSVSGESNQFSGDGTSGNVLTLRSSSVTLQGNTFNNANQLVKLDGSGYFPGLNGSLITNLSGANVSGDISGNAANITGNLSVSQVNLSTVMPLGAIPQQYVNLSTVTDALAGKIGVGTNIPMENVNLSTVAASISDLYATKRSTGVPIEISAINLSTVMPLGAVPQQYVNLSTVTDALAGKIGVGTNIPMENVNLSTVAASISDLYATKRSTGIAIEASAIDLSTVMPLGAVPQQYVNLSTVTDALAGKIGVGTNIPMENVNLSTVTDALAGKIGVGANIPMENVDLSTVTDALAGKIGVGTNIPIENVNLSTVAASISDLYATKRSTGVAIETSSVNLSTVAASISDLYATKRSTGVAIEASAINLSTVTDALAGKLDKSGGVMSGDLQVGDQYASTIAAAGYLTLANLGSAPGVSRGRLYFDPSGDGALKVSLNGSSFVSIATGTAGAGLSSVSGESNQFSGDGTSGNVLTLRSSSVTLQGNTFNNANQLVKLDGSGYFPGLNGSLITNLSGANVSGNISGNAANITGNLSISQVNLSTVMPLGAVPQQYVNLSTVTDALAGKIGVGTNIPMENVNLSTVAASISDLYAVKRSTGVAIEASAINLSTVMPLGAVPQQYVNLSTVTDALAGKIGVGTNIPMENVNLSTVAASISDLYATKRSTGVAIEVAAVNLSTVAASISDLYATKRSTGVAIEISAINLSTVMPLGAVPQQYVNLSTVTDALAGKIGVGTNIPMENVNLSTVAASISDLYATKRSTGVAIEVSAVNLSTVAASISDLYATKRSTGVAIEAAAIDLSTVMPLGAVPQQYVNLSTVTDALAGKLDKSGGAMSGDLQVGDQYASTIAAAGYLTLANLGSAPGSSRGRLYFDPTGDGALKVSLNGSSFVSIATGTAGAGLSSVSGESNQFSGDGTSGNVLTLRSSSVTLQGNTFNNANQLVKLDGSGYFPGLNGSLITNLSGANVSGNISGNAANITGNLSVSQVNLSTVTDALAGKIGVGTNIPMENVNLSTVAASISDLYATKRSTGIAIEASAIDLSTVMPLGAVPQQYVNLSTVTDALAGKIGVGTNIPMENVNLSTVAASISDLYATKRSTGVAIEAAAVNLSTVAASISDLYVAKLSTGVAIEASTINLSTVMPLGAVPQQYVNLSTVTDALAGKIGVGTNIPMENVNLSTVAASISDLYATKRSTGVAIETSAVNLSTVAASISDLYATKRSTGLAVEASAVDLSTVTTALADKVSKVGDGMTGPLTMLGNSTITVLGDAFSVGATTLVVTNGWVGIGTAAPLGALHVAPGNASVLISSMTVGTGQASAVVPVLTLSGATGIGQPSWDGKTRISYNSLGFVISHDGGSPSGQLMGPRGFGLGTSGREGDMFIDPSGAVGIATAAPQSRLHVSSGAGEAGDLLVVSTGTSNVFRVTGQGEVYANKLYGDGSQLSGITGGAGKVDKAGDGMTGPLTMLGASSMTVTGAFGVGAAGLSGGLVVLQSTTATAGHPILITQNNVGAEILRVQQDGKVGIGTAGVPDANAKFEVKGGAIKATDGLIIETRAGDPPSPVVGQIWLINP